MKKTVLFLSFLLLLPNILVSMEEVLEITVKSINFSAKQVHLLRCTGLMYNNKLLGVYKHGCILSKDTFNTAVQIKEELTDKQLEKILEYFDHKPFNFYYPANNTNSLAPLAEKTDQLIQTKFMSLMTTTPRAFKSITYSAYACSTTTNRITPADASSFHTWSYACLHDNPTLGSVENIKALYIQHIKNGSAHNAHCISSLYTKNSIQKQASMLAAYHEQAEYIILSLLGLPKDLKKNSDLRKFLIRKNLEFARNKLIYSGSGGLATLVPSLITGVLNDAGFSEECKYLCANITPKIEGEIDEKEEERTEDDVNNGPGYLSWGYWWPPTEIEEK